MPAPADDLLRSRHREQAEPDGGIDWANLMQQRVQRGCMGCRRIVEVAEIEGTGRGMLLGKEVFPTRQRAGGTAIANEGRPPFRNSVMTRPGNARFSQRLHRIVF